MDNSRYNTSDVKKICVKKLNIGFNKRHGKRAPHFTGWFCRDGKKIKRITVAKGKKPIPPKTYKTMANQLGLSVSLFDDLLECPLTLDKYLKEINLSQ